MYITGLIVLGLLQGSFMTIQAIPDSENKRPEEERSLPLSIDQAGDIIYISSKKDISDLRMEITDSSGNVWQEEHLSLNAQQTYAIYIGELPAEGLYCMTLRQDSKQIVTYLF